MIGVNRYRWIVQVNLKLFFPLVNIAQCLAQRIAGNQVKPSQLFPVPLKELVDQGLGFLLAIITQCIAFQPLTTDVIFNLYSTVELHEIGLIPCRSSVDLNYRIHPMGELRNSVNPLSCMGYSVFLISN